MAAIQTSVFSGPSVPSLGMATGASTLCSSKGRVPRANAKATWQHQQRGLDIMDFPSLLPSAVVVLEWVSRVPKHLLAGYLEHDGVIGVCSLGNNWTVSELLSATTGYKWMTGAFSMAQESKGRALHWETVELVGHMTKRQTKWWWENVCNEGWSSENIKSC